MKSSYCNRIITGVTIVVWLWAAGVSVWAQDGGTSSVFALPEKEMGNSQPDSATSSDSVFKLPAKEAAAQEKSPFMLPPPAETKPAATGPAAVQQEESQDPGELLEAANVAAKEGRNEEAGKMYSRVLELDPSNVKAMNNLGIVLKRLGRHEDALQAYHYAIQTDETYPLTHKNIGILLEIMNDPEGAVAAYRRYIELVPSAPDSGAVRQRINWLTQ